MTEPEFDMKDWLHAVIDDEAGKTTTPLLVGIALPTCYPHALRIDGKNRTVTCSRCRLVFGAFEALDYLSREWRHYAANLQAIKADCAHLTGHRAGLRKEVAKLKAMAKRAKASEVASRVTAGMRKKGAEG